MSELQRGLTESAKFASTVLVFLFLKRFLPDLPDWWADVVAQTLTAAVSGGFVFIFLEIVLGLPRAKVTWKRGRGRPIESNDYDIGRQKTTVHATVQLSGSRLWMAWLRHTQRRTGLQARITLSPSGLLRLVGQTVPTGTAVHTHSVTLDLEEQLQHGGVSYIEFSVEPVATPATISPVHVSMDLEATSGRAPLALRLARSSTSLDTLRFGG